MQAELAVQVAEDILLILLDNLKEIIMGDLHGWKEDFVIINFLVIFLSVKD